MPCPLLDMPMLSSTLPLESLFIFSEKASDFPCQF
jgi:hypothetical protein